MLIKIQNLISFTFLFGFLLLYLGPTYTEQLWPKENFNVKEECLGKRVASAREILLIRATSLTEGQYERIKIIALDLMEHLRDAELWVSFDVTKSNSSELPQTKADRMIRGGKERINTHKYNEKMVKKRFKGHLDYSFRPKYQFLRFSHVEAIVLFLEHSRLNSLNWETLWVMEEDVGFSGDISKLLRFYREEPRYRNADLLSEEFSIKNASWSGWPFHSKAYRRMIQGMPIYFSKEHIQRFSRRFVNTIADLLDKNVSAQSEQFTPTMCMNLNFSCVEFDRRHISADSFSPKSRISRWTWENEMLKNPARKDKLYHALKF